MKKADYVALLMKRKKDDLVKAGISFQPKQKKEDALNSTTVVNLKAATYKLAPVAKPRGSSAAGKKGRSSSKRGGNAVGYKTIAVCGAINAPWDYFPALENVCSYMRLSQNFNLLNGAEKGSGVMGASTKTFMDSFKGVGKPVTSDSSAKIASEINTLNIDLKRGISIGVNYTYDGKGTPFIPNLDLKVTTNMPMDTGPYHQSNSRNRINAESCDAMIATPGGGGTLSEILFAIKNNKPVIVLVNSFYNPTIVNGGAKYGNIVSGTNVFNNEQNVVGPYTPLIVTQCTSSTSTRYCWNPNFLKGISSYSPEVRKTFEKIIVTDSEAEVKRWLQRRQVEEEPSKILALDAGVENILNTIEEERKRKEEEKRQAV